MTSGTHTKKTFRSHSLAIQWVIQHYIRHSYNDNPYGQSGFFFWVIYDDMRHTYNYSSSGQLQGHIHHTTGTDTHWITNRYVSECLSRQNMLASYQSRLTENITSLKTLLLPLLEFASQITWWCPQIKTFATLMTICEANPLVTGGFPSQRPVT